MAVIVMTLGLRLFTKIGASNKNLNLNQKEFIFEKKPFLLAEFFENPSVAPPQPVHPWPELRGW